MAIHRIEPGETLSSIAAAHGMTWRELYEHPRNEEFRNTHPDPNLIRVNEEIWVPPDEGGPIRQVVLERDDDEEDDDHMHPWVAHEEKYVHPYKVRTGDTLASIAEQVGCTWQEIALLNWGTDDPKEINWYLKTYFVCKRKSGANYVFSDDDDPGILLLPRELSVTHQQRRRLRASRFTIQE